MTARAGWGDVLLIGFLAAGALCLSCAQECAGPECGRDYDRHDIRGYADFEPCDDETPGVNDHDDEHITVMLDVCEGGTVDDAECRWWGSVKTTCDAGVNFIFEDMPEGMYRILARKSHPNPTVTFWTDVYDGRSPVFRHSKYGPTVVDVKLELAYTVRVPSDIFVKVDYEHLPDPDPEVDDDPDDGISVYLHECFKEAGGFECQDIVCRQVSTDEAGYNAVFEMVRPGIYLLSASRMIPSVFDSCVDVYCANSPVFDHRHDRHTYAELKLTYCRSICPY